MRRPRIAVPEINQNIKNDTKALLAAGMEAVLGICRGTPKTFESEARSEIMEGRMGI